jgi:hypothetical protein
MVNLMNPADLFSGYLDSNKSALKCTMCEVGYAFMSAVEEGPH